MLQGAQPVSGGQLHEPDRAAILLFLVVRVYPLLPVALVLIGI